MSGRLNPERVGQFANVAKNLGTEITWGPRGAAHIQSFRESGTGVSGVVLKVQQINRVTELCSAETVDPSGKIDRVDILNGNFTDAPEGGIKIGFETHGITIHPDSSAHICHPRK